MLLCCWISYTCNVIHKINAKTTTFYPTLDSLQTRTMLSISWDLLVSVSVSVSIFHIPRSQSQYRFFKLQSLNMSLSWNFIVLCSKSLSISLSIVRLSGISLSLSIENCDFQVSVSVSVSKILISKSQSQSQYRNKSFQSLSLSIELKNMVSSVSGSLPKWWDLLVFFFANLVTTTYGKNRWLSCERLASSLYGRQNTLIIVARIGNTQLCRIYTTSCIYVMRLPVMCWEIYGHWGHIFQLLPLRLEKYFKLLKV